NLEERSGRQSCRLGSRRGPGLPRTPCAAARTRVVPGAERGPQRSGTGRVEGPRHPEEFGRSTHRDGAGEIRPVVSIREEEGYIVRADLDGRAARVVHDDADPDTHVVETRQRGRRREIQEGRPPGHSRRHRKRLHRRTRWAVDVHDPVHTDDPGRAWRGPVHPKDGTTHRGSGGVRFDDRLTDSSGLVELLCIPGSQVVEVHGSRRDVLAHDPGFASRLSHCSSVFGELCRNTAFFALVFQAAVTFPDALVSKVQGVPETKSPSTTWFVKSARNEMPAESAAKLESKLPFAANWPGRSHERFWAFQGSVALPLSRSTPCRSSPALVPIVHVTVR